MAGKGRAGDISPLIMLGDQPWTSLLGSSEHVREGAQGRELESAEGQVWAG